MSYSIQFHTHGRGNLRMYCVVTYYVEAGRFACVTNAQWIVPGTLDPSIN